jgi:tRNA pseudouridine(38-40) synthase
MTPSRSGYSLTRLPVLHADSLLKVNLGRAARTDAGVHAAGNVVSIKMIIDVPGVPDIVMRINEELPPEIRVWGFVSLHCNLTRPNSHSLRSECKIHSMRGCLCSNIFMYCLGILKFNSVRLGPAIVGNTRTSSQPI